MNEDKTLYLFIGDIFGGILRSKSVVGYFHPIENYIKNTHTFIETDYLQNPATASIENGANLIAGKVQEACLLNGFQVILVGHGRGALEILNFIKKYPQLADLPQLKKIIFASPLFGPSYFAAKILKYLSVFIPSQLKKSLIEISNPNLTEIVKSDWEEILKLETKKISHKILEIKTSSKNKSNYPLILKFLNYKIFNSQGENNGVISLDSQQSLKEVEFIHLDSNHIALFGNRTVNKNSQVSIKEIYHFLTPIDFIEEGVLSPNYKVSNKQTEQLLSEEFNQSVYE